MNAPETEKCKVCSAPAVFLGTKAGTFKKDTEFVIFRCTNCGFAFVGNPWLEFDRIYSEEYYKGRGADPSVDYMFELERPDETVRKYEWQGIVKAVGSRVPLTRETRWLDFGCGNGGLVRYCRQRTGSAVFGYEEGWIRDQAMRAGIPVLGREELGSLTGSFDIVTAIEVLEHLPDPVVELRRIRSLLRPGGLLFFTTGNAAPFRNRLLRWPYVLPEVHVSFFEPCTLDLALRQAGFKPEFAGFVPGFEEIIRFKVLKNLGIRKVSKREKLLPWSLLSKLIDSRRRISDLPVGWAA
jgi:SAM-dependent methyltransferase